MNHVNKETDDGWKAISTGSCASINTIEHKNRKIFPLTFTQPTTTSSDCESNDSYTQKSSNRSSDERRDKKRGSVTNHSLGVNVTQPINNSNITPPTSADRNRSKSTSKRHSPRKHQQYMLWIFTPADLPLVPVIRISIGDVKYSSEKNIQEDNHINLIEEELQKYNLNVFLIIESQDVDKLDSDCKLKLDKLLKKLNIVRDLVYLAGRTEPATLSERVIYFSQLINIYKNKNIAIFGINTTNIVYVMLASFWIPNIVNYILDNNHKLKIADEFVSIKDILGNKLIYSLSTKLLVKHTLDIVYQLVIPKILEQDEKLWLTFSNEEQQVIETYCANVIHTHITF